METIVIDGTNEITQSVSLDGINASVEEESITIDGEAQIVSIESVDGRIEIGFDGEFGAVTVVERGERQKYKGDYTVTPSSQTQTLLTAEMIMTDNVIINPIPKNYGLITWNGSRITVS